MSLSLPSFYLSFFIFNPLSLCLSVSASQSLPLSLCLFSLCSLRLSVLNSHLPVSVSQGMYLYLIVFVSEYLSLYPNPNHLCKAIFVYLSAV